MTCHEPLFPSGRRRRHAAGLRCRPSSGLATLEWLLIIAAVGGLAAVMVVAVQRILDDAAEVNANRSVRVLEARVTAAELSAEASAAANGGALDPDGSLFTELRERCEQLASDYPGSVDAAEWVQVPPDDRPTDPTTATTVAENPGTTTATTLAPSTTLAESVPTTLATETPAARWTCRLTGSPA